MPHVNIEQGKPKHLMLEELTFYFDIEFIYDHIEKLANSLTLEIATSVSDLFLRNLLSVIWRLRPQRCF